MGSVRSATTRTSGASRASASSVAVTEPSSEFSIGTTARSTARASTASIASRTEEQATASAPGGASARTASSLWVPLGPRKATRTLVSAPKNGLERPPGGSDLLGRERGPDRLRLLRRELELRLAAAHGLDVYTGLVAVEDRGDHDAGLVRVQKGDGARLPARHLAVGVVADDRVVREAAVEPALDAAGAVVEVTHRVLDPVAQLGEPRLKALGVGDEIATAVAEHGALSPPQSADPDQREHGDPEREHRAGRRAHRDQPGRLDELLHGLAG